MEDKASKGKIGCTIFHQLSSGFPPARLYGQGSPDGRTYIDH